MVSEEKMFSEEKHVERIDALTGCANLLAFLETLSARLKSPADSVFSLLLVDMNNFMAFNRVFGHARGDSVLHWVGIVLRDTGLPVYRIGGDHDNLLHNFKFLGPHTGVTETAAPHTF
jgi:diguanylate cyclase (GGDEF)-like protein